MQNRKIKEGEGDGGIYVEAESLSRQISKEIIHRRYSSPL